MTVTFSDIEIIELSYSIGDNPSVSNGTVPISIDWDAHSRIVLPLDYFEQIRPTKRPEVRRFSARTRERILRRKGYSALEIEIAMVEAMKAKQDRAKTVYRLAKIGALKLKKTTKSGKGILLGNDRPPVLPQRRLPSASTRNGVVPMAA